MGILVGTHGIPAEGVWRSWGESLRSYCELIVILMATHSNPDGNSWRYWWTLMGILEGTHCDHTHSDDSVDSER